MPDTVTSTTRDSRLSPRRMQQTTAKQHQQQNPPPQQQRPLIQAPRLSPITLQPCGLSKTSTAIDRLARVRFVKINATVLKGGKVFYVIAVHFSHTSSHIPTIHDQAPPSLSLSLSDRSTSLLAMAAPDMLVARRFSAFARLRHQFIEIVQQRHDSFCAPCDRVMLMLLTARMQPHVIAKTLLRSIPTRTKILDTFLSTILAELWHVGSFGRQSCHAQRQLLSVLHDFLLDLGDGPHDAIARTEPTTMTS